MSSEKYQNEMLNLATLPGNNICADCSNSDPPPTFISLKLGVFVCIKCSGIHRSLGPQCSNIKSIKLDTMTEDMVKQIEKEGNSVAKKRWEYDVPECWPNIQKNSFPYLIEQWIRAKYERNEFVKGESAKRQPYANGSKYGWLMKKEKSSSKWNKRFFVLSSQQGYMSYFIKQEDSDPKQRIHISQINIMLLPEEQTQRKHSLLISFPSHNNGFSKQRHVYLYHDTSFEIVDWYMSIRAARLNYLRPYLYGVEKPVVDHLLSRNFIKMGILYKTGSKNGDSWKKRFVCIDTHRFLYFEKALDAEPVGEVDIESDGMDCFAMEGVDGNHPNPPTKHCFFVHSRILPNTRKPVYNFCADTREEMLSWLSAFRKAMKQLEWLEHIQDKSRRISILSNFSSRCLSNASVTP